MNRQQALEWLVENVVRWPENIDFSSDCYGWDFWCSENEDVVFSENHGWRDCPDEKGSGAKVITKPDWLAATDNMQVKDEQ